MVCGVSGVKQWYILSYDIHHPVRLRRFHYRISKEAVALQKSVYLIEADDKQLREVERIVADCVHRHKDDVRLYPIHHPRDLWGAGRQAESFAALPRGRKPRKRTLKQKVFSLFGREP